MVSKPLTITAFPPDVATRACAMDHTTPSEHRNIPIPPEVVHTVRDYLTERTDRCGPFTAKDPLFVTGTAAAFTRQSLAWHVQRWFTRAGIAHAPGEQVHRLRHTYAVGLVSNGVPINQVQALLGHTNLSSTRSTCAPPPPIWLPLSRTPLSAPPSSTPGSAETGSELAGRAVSPARRTHPPGVQSYGLQ